MTDREIDDRVSKFYQTGREFRQKNYRDIETRDENQPSIFRLWWDIMVYFFAIIKSAGSALIFTIWFIIGIRIFSASTGVEWVLKAVPYVYGLYAPSHFLYELVVNLKFIRKKKKQ